MDARGRFLMSIHSFILRAPGLTVLVDTCVGNDKPRQNPGWHMLQTDFLDRLAAAGCPPESVDLVLCTHLHVDHVGWNTRLDNGRWVPTFPRARYLFARTEWEHWSKVDGDEYGPIIADSVRPIVEAGRADLVEGNHRISEELTLEPTPGHTPGHVSLSIRSQGRRGRRHRRPHAPSGPVRRARLAEQLRRRPGESAGHAARLLRPLRRPRRHHPRHPLRRAHRRAAS